MYNNPYVINSALRGAGGLGKVGLFSSIRNLNWANLLGNTQKTLGIINQAIPIVYQVKPIVNNAKTMFRVMGAMRGDNTQEYATTNQNISPNVSEAPVTTNRVDNQPMFFI